MCGIHQSTHSHIWKQGGGENDGEVYKNKKSLMNGWIHQALLVEGGGYLLSHFRSTIGVAGFNFSVRNGKRWSPRAMATLVFFLCPGTGCRRSISFYQRLLPAGMGQVGSTLEAEKLILCVCDSFGLSCICYIYSFLFWGILSPGKGSGD